MKKNIFKELKKRNVPIAIGRAYLMGHRTYFIITSARYEDKVEGLEFSPRVKPTVLKEDQQEPLTPKTHLVNFLEREMDDDDIINFSKEKEEFVMAHQDKDGAIYEQKNKSLKRHLKKMYRTAPQLVIALDRITENTGAKRDKAIEEAKELVSTL